MQCCKNRLSTGLATSSDGYWPLNIPRIMARWADAVEDPESYEAFSTEQRSKSKRVKSPIAKARGTRPRKEII
jgi:hypothetical protein